MIQLLGITVLTVFANMIGSITGFGLSTIMTPILLWYLPFAQVVLLVATIHWFHDVWRLIFFRYAVDWKLILSFGLPSIICTAAGAALVAEQYWFLPSLLGFFLIIYALFLWGNPHLVLKRSWWSSLIGGALSGFFAGIFGIRGAIRTAVLFAYHLPKKTFIATAAAITFLVDSVRIVTYFGTGLRLSSSMFYGLIFFIPASFLGSWIGTKIVHRLPQEQFRQAVLIFLLLAGIRLLIVPIISH